MRLKIKRKFLGDKYTIGDFYINEVFFCNTLEDKVRDTNKDGDLNDFNEGKVYGETAIPYGEYDVVLSMSPKFKRLLPEILNVPHFTGIRIHCGNTAEDSAGCPLLGENKIKGMVINSAKYEKELVKVLKETLKTNEPITIKIV